MHTLTNSNMVDMAERANLSYHNVIRRIIQINRLKKVGGIMIMAVLQSYTYALMESYDTFVHGSQEVYTCE